MKKFTALVLTFLLVFSTVLVAFPAGVFADGAVEITEAAEGYTGSLGYNGYIARKKGDE